MNPVDHVRLHDCHVTITIRCGSADTLCSLTVVVTTSILAKPRPSLVTPPRVKRLVSSPPDGQVCFVVRKRSRSRCGGRHEFMEFGRRLSQSQRLWPIRHELDARRPNENCSQHLHLHLHPTTISFLFPMRDIRMSLECLLSGQTSAHAYRHTTLDRLSPNHDEGSSCSNHYVA